MVVHALFNDKTTSQVGLRLILHVRKFENVVHWWL